MTQKLSATARRTKLARDLAAAKTPSRRNKKAENQRLRRAAKKSGVNLEGKDYDHTKKKFVSVKANRGGHGKGTKKK
jgi:hypothetical protein